MNKKRLLIGLVPAIVLIVFPAGSVGAVGEGEPSGKIVFTFDADPTNEEIGVIEADGRRRRNLTRSEGFDVAPAWSPDGSRIAFTSSRSMPPGSQTSPLFYSDLYVMRANGSNVKRMTFTNGLLDFQPAWSPDGRSIVVMRAAATKQGQVQPFDLVIINLATGQERQLTSSPNRSEFFPHWSPDGRRIAFESDLLEPGNTDIYTIKVNGTGLRRLTNFEGLDGDVRYSPDGTRLLFASERASGGLGRDLFLMRTDGTHVRQLTTNNDSHSGGFSPDGRFITFTRDISDTNSDIFRMRANGTHQINLTRTPSTFEFDPEWQPR